MNKNYSTNHLTQQERDNLADKVVQVLLDDVYIQNFTIERAYKVLGHTGDVELTDEQHDEITAKQFEILDEVLLSCMRPQPAPKTPFWMIKAGTGGWLVMAVLVAELIYWHYTATGGF